MTPEAVQKLAKLANEAAQEAQSDSSKVDTALVLADIAMRAHHEFRTRETWEAAKREANRLWPVSA